MQMNCMICAKEFTYFKDDHCSINVAIVGAEIEMRGHRECLENVNRLVVLPNKARLMVLGLPKKRKAANKTIQKLD